MGALGFHSCICGEVYRELFSPGPDVVFGAGAGEWMEESVIMQGPLKTVCRTDVSELVLSFPTGNCAAVLVLQGEKAFQPRAPSSILMNSIPWKVVVSLFMQTFCSLNGLQL